MMYIDKLNEIVAEREDVVLKHLNLAFNAFIELAETAADAHTAIHLFELQNMLSETLGSHNKSDAIFQYIFNNDDYTTLHEAVQAAYKAQWCRIINQQSG